MLAMFPVGKIYACVANYRFFGWPAEGGTSPSRPGFQKQNIYRGNSGRLSVKRSTSSDGKDVLLINVKAFGWQEENK